MQVSILQQEYREFRFEKPLLFPPFAREVELFETWGEALVDLLKAVGCHLKLQRQQQQHLISIMLSLR
jgi:hypothetical protein